jgi:two-component system response regulator YesN
MFNVILVEDEPAAAENIRDILQLYCPQFLLIAAGDNGEAGFELARQHNPDLLITDVRMPRMNGLQLIAKIHKEMPHIKTMILSGYEDFEYARTALQQGSIDYLLKPISPASLKAALERVIPLLKAGREQHRLLLLHRLLNNDIPEKNELAKYFTSPGYNIALCRKNGLPSRFSWNNAGIKYEFNDNTIDINGRDEMESIHISSSGDEYSADRPEAINWTNKDIQGYTTTIIWNKPFPIEELPVILEYLYNILNIRLAVGISQTILANDKSHTGKKNIPPDFELQSSLDHYIHENENNHIITILLNSLDKYEKDRRTQLFVEESIRLFFEKIRFELNPSHDEELEIMIDDAFYYAANYGELKESLLYILAKLLPDKRDTVCKIDSPDFFNLIREYVNVHLAEQMNLQSVCLHFGISQTYISRLFRKYTDKTFINYLTGIRIEKAKQYLSDKNTLIKDAAAMAGFNDQFYFSRVFRSLTGVSPSEYIQGT